MIGSPSGLVNVEADLPVASPASACGRAGDGIISGDATEVLLSFDVGLGWDGLTIWRHDGGVWTQYDPDLLTYGSDGMLSFTVSGFSGYAVTVIPEPAALALLAVGGLAICRARRRLRAPSPGGRGAPRPGAWPGGTPTAAVKEGLADPGGAAQALGR